MKMFSDPYYYLGLLVGGLTAYWLLNRDKSSGTSAGTSAGTSRISMDDYTRSVRSNTNPNLFQ